MPSSTSPARWAPSAGSACSIFPPSIWPWSPTPGAGDGIDRAYGALAAYVARHAMAVDGPVREFYPVSRHHSADPDRWRTEIGWPIFPTRPAQ